MNTIKLNDDFLQKMASKSSKDKTSVCGRGLDRVTISVTKDIVVKIPQFYYDGAYPIKFTFLIEYQTKMELDLLKHFPWISNYIPKLIKVGKIDEAFYITFWEKLIPAVNDWGLAIKDKEIIKKDIRNLLESIKKNAPKNTRLEIADLHLRNFGYNKNDEIKILDFGLWDESVDDFSIDDFCLQDEFADEFYISNEE